MNIVCSGAGEWPQIFRKREGRVFFDELEPYSLGSQPARPGQAELRPCLVLYRGEGGGIDCGPGGSDVFDRPIAGNAGLL